MELSKKDCIAISKKAFKRDDVTVVKFGFSSASGAARGFIAVSNVLEIHVDVDGVVRVLRFFIKLPPNSPFHLKLVRQTRAFFKESQFFLRVYPLLKKFLIGKIFPRCYFSNENLTVLEDLTALGYNNARPGILDRRHVEATLRSLATYHAASFAAEISENSTFDRICPDILFVSWFSDLPDHPGHVHLQTGIKAVKAVFDRYFPHVSQDVRDEAVELLKTLPKLLVPSKNYRNCLSHNDLWSNNIMFKYGKTGSSDLGKSPQAGNADESTVADSDEIENACLIDMQLFGYNPPAHDVYTLLLLNCTDDSSRNHVPDLVKFYYENISETLAKHGLNPDDILSFEDFNKSKPESLPLALGSALLFTHFTTLPEQYLSEIISNEEMLSKMMHQDRAELVFKSIDTVPEYKSRLFAMIDNLFDYLSGKWSL